MLQHCCSLVCYCLLLLCVQVNLLDDHLVDVLLDSAASGWNTVEREGISISHPARFILVGSGETLWEEVWRALL
jgi:Mg-chelatase subunit ChlI